MKGWKIIRRVVKDLGRRVSGVSNFKEIDGIRSGLLDVFLLEENEKNRKKYWEIIKLELENKILKEEKKEIPRQQYITNIQRVLKDLEKRVDWEKTDDNRQHLLDLDKKQSFNRELLKIISDETIRKAKFNNKLHKENLFKNLTKNEKYKKDILWFLKHRSGHIEDKTHKKNINKLIQRLGTEKETTKERSKTQKIIATTWMAVWILLVLWWSIKIIFDKKDHKNVDQKETPLAENKNKTSKEIVVDCSQIQISDSLLTDGITQKDLLNAVENIISKEAKQKIINFLEKEDVIW